MSKVAVVLALILCVGCDARLHVESKNSEAKPSDAPRWENNPQMPFMENWRYVRDGIILGRASGYQPGELSAFVDGAFCDGHGSGFTSLSAAKACVERNAK